VNFTFLMFLLEVSNFNYLNLLSSDETFQTLIEKIAPTWMNLSIQMKEDKETDETFGWVLEM
jgi:hypothetical protein